uniref:Uncharacterized protein n=1 Tax=Chromera velia CCMP2878 TaxID=1169474 RepID=A0A0G4HN07_9ALVE|eukprot:Cvel_7560.t1-p1 / transcript=Cvel_7560.t1 / gene=Cvel_7560 / organism=Chromera_velia_CCMP2878 / gene_product=hypothetical protein / transcript_product=hypothetical protein / location=Cvel_scaffold398:284-649(-) / protein_length=122 / sequence_SO=supercontig / SO=protein_coding / is_pseudo=false
MLSPGHQEIVGRGEEKLNLDGACEYDDDGLPRVYVAYFKPEVGWFFQNPGADGLHKDSEAKLDSKGESTDMDVSINASSDRNAVKIRGEQTDEQRETFTATTVSRVDPWENQLGKQGMEEGK